jgi:hypothetical protein
MDHCLPLASQQFICDNENSFPGDSVYQRKGAVWPHIQPSTRRVS